jgi:hypothetical protein
VDSLQAHQLLLAQRKRQRIAEGGAAVRRDGCTLRIGQPAVGADAAEEVASHGAGSSGSRLRPGPEPRPEVDRSSSGVGRKSRQSTGRYGERSAGRRAGRKHLIARAGADEPSGHVRVVALVGWQASSDARAPKPHLFFVGRCPATLPVSTLRAFACLHDLSLPQDFARQVQPGSRCRGV